jgi:hypothetical protein
MMKTPVPVFCDLVGKAGLLSVHGLCPADTGLAAVPRGSFDGFARSNTTPGT